MKNSVCYIVGASTFDEKIQPGKDDLVIACDGGYRYLSDKGVRIDCVLGDFDSLCNIPNEKNLFIYPVEKDDTDMRIAVDYGMEKGYKKFFIFGGVGGRLDHTMANIQLLLYLARQNCSGFLIGEGVKITVIKDRKFIFSGNEKGYFSVFALGSAAKGVTIKNAKYTLDNKELACDYALGVSNEFSADKPAEISVSFGELCIIWYEKYKKSGGAENEN